jgi:hypothetical protein
MMAHRPVRDSIAVMERVQVQLTDEQLRFLRERSKTSGLSIAAQVRSALDRLMEEEGRRDRFERLLSVAGAFDSGRSEISEKHDLFLDDAFER